jgi:predicted nucleotide-binding protein (sugar kinase/HSP70/actin superfamily)
MIALKFLEGNEEKQVSIIFHTKEQKRYRESLERAKKELQTISQNDYREFQRCFRRVKHYRRELRKQTRILNKLQLGKD